ARRRHRTRPATSMTHGVPAHPGRDAPRGGLPPPYTPVATATSEGAHLTMTTTASTPLTALERAERLALVLDLAGVPGNPRVTTTGGLNLAVALTREDGSDLVVVAVEVWKDGPVYYVTRYDVDDEAAECHEVHDQAGA